MQFKELGHAYSVLSDSKKRELYDRGGEDAVKSGGMSGGSDPFDLFGSFFGFGGRQRDRRERRTKDMVHELSVTLEDLCKGKVTKLAVTRDGICSRCEGAGTMKKNVARRQCTECGGSGLVIKLAQVAPGFVQRMRAKCDRCGGGGQVIAAKDRCKPCKGRGMVEERKIIGTGACACCKPVP